MPRQFRLFLSAVALLLAPAARAESVLCHLDYGGETRSIEARPVVSPYAVAAQPIGSYFLFRVVFQKQPLAQASIKIYVYASADSGPAPIHQLSHPYPPPPGTRGGAGFTGVNLVYEPLRDGELRYWCEWINGLDGSHGANGADGLPGSPAPGGGWR